MAVTFYGKSTCGTSRKARAWLDERGINYTEKDIITQPPPRQLLEREIDSDDVKRFLNPRSTLYREHNMGTDPPSKTDAIDLMCQDPNLIRRPIVVSQRAVTFGFAPSEFEQALENR